MFEVSNTAVPWVACAIHGESVIIAELTEPASAFCPNTV